MEAYATLCTHMNIDGLPAIMLIKGHGTAFGLVGVEPGKCAGGKSKKKK
jgi:hypothetical protein